MRVIFWTAGLALGIAIGSQLARDNDLKVTQQNEGTCRNCGAQTIITIRERKGEEQ